jgi:hypothetical protein
MSQSPLEIVFQDDPILEIIEIAVNEKGEKPNGLRNPCRNLKSENY